jgi:hypothetical protein
MILEIFKIKTDFRDLDTKLLMFNGRLTLFLPYFFLIKDYLWLLINQNLKEHSLKSKISSI